MFNFVHNPPSITEGVLTHSLFTFINILFFSLFDNSQSIKNTKKEKLMLLKKYLATCSIHRKAIFAADVLNFCVRDGNRCDHIAIITRSFLKVVPSKLNNTLLTNS